MQSSYTRNLVFFLTTSLKIQYRLSYILTPITNRRHSFTYQVFPSSETPSFITSTKATNPSNNDNHAEIETKKYSCTNGWIDLDATSEEVKIASSTVSKKYQIAEYTDLHPTFYPQNPSPVQKLTIEGRIVYVKRDDLLKLEGSNVSGNKARKMLYFHELPPEIFPSVIVSYGGPQSNAMIALAAMVHSKNIEIGSDVTLENDKKSKRFVYYTKKLPRWLRKTPSGNFLRAMSLGMELREVSYQEYNDLFGGENGGSNIPPLALDPPEFGDSLWIPQGGACEYARYGINPLAIEIVSFWENLQLKQKETVPLSIVLPGGTCTTAFFLHDGIQSIVKELNHRNTSNHIPLDIEVVVIPCVGSADYAKRQMMNLATSMTTKDSDSMSEKDFPKILRPISTATNPERKYYSFGEPNQKILEIFNFMNKNNVNLDLLYGAPAWDVLLQHWSCSDKLSGRQIMYVHSGGLEGISSQMTRYKQKGMMVEDFNL